MRLPAAALVLLSLVALRPAAGQEAGSRATLEDLTFLAGHWSGTLEYLDYADGRTRQTLEASMESTLTDGAIEYRFSYVEPNGKRVTGDKVRLTLAERGAVVRVNDDAWRVAAIATGGGRGMSEIVLVREGEDDDRPAQLRRTLESDGKTLRIRTEVRRASEPWFTRNEHVLTRRAPRERGSGA